MQLLVIKVDGDILTCLNQSSALKHLFRPEEDLHTLVQNIIIKFIQPCVISTNLSKQNGT